jgi:hypothetical protein
METENFNNSNEYLILLCLIVSHVQTGNTALLNTSSIASEPLNGGQEISRDMTKSWLHGSHMDSDQY